MIRNNTLQRNIARNYTQALGKKSILETKPIKISLPKINADLDYFPISCMNIFYKNKKELNEYFSKPLMYLELLCSHGQGEGTRAIKNVVKSSLENKKTEGRVALHAGIIDLKKGSPMGFYYKMGFRSVSEKYNKICEEWLKNGGKESDRPFAIKYNIFAPQVMYLPKENIEQCLHYPERTLYYYV